MGGLPVAVTPMSAKVTPGLSSGYRGVRPMVPGWVAPGRLTHASQANLLSQALTQWGVACCIWGPGHLAQLPGKVSATQKTRPTAGGHLGFPTPTPTAFCSQDVEGRGRGWGQTIA